MTILANFHDMLGKTHLKFGSLSLFSRHVILMLDVLSNIHVGILNNSARGILIIIENELKC